MRETLLFSSKGRGKAVAIFDAQVAPRRSTIRELRYCSFFVVMMIITIILLLGGCVAGVGKGLGSDDGLELG